MRLKPGREKPVLNRHPWIFSGAIDSLSSSDFEEGDLVNVIDSKGNWLALAYINSNSQISARVISWKEEIVVNREFWKQLLLQAIMQRNQLLRDERTSAYRLVNGESDLIPGLVADFYNGFVVVQCLSLGIDRRKNEFFDLLDELLQPKGIIERSDSPMRKREGLTKVVGLRRGQQPPEHLVVVENDIKMYVDLYRGHKTGLYLDQRDNRVAVCDSRNVSEKEILNVFAYTGSFAIHAFQGGADKVVNVESSRQMLDLCNLNLDLNGFKRPEDEFLLGDAFNIIRELKGADEKFDMIILDPPKFAQSRSDVEAACRGYKDLNLIAMQLLRKQGLLATFSCSGHVSADLFQKVIFGASIDAGRDVQIVRQFGQASDHPILLTFPESAYLKGFLCRVL